MTDKEKLNAAIELIMEMGAVIRYLDEDFVYLKYWLTDGNDIQTPFVSEAIDKGIMD
jgi:hypothetical protein